MNAIGMGGVEERTVCWRSIIINEPTNTKKLDHDSRLWFLR